MTTRAPESSLRAKLREVSLENRQLREAAQLRVWMEELDDTVPDSALIVYGEPTRLVRALRCLIAHLGFSWVVEGRT